jgi:eukaryotic-like serine/threonine-protein kinase
MSQPDPIFPPGSPLGSNSGGKSASLAERIEKAATRFESAWKRDERPKLEVFLAEFADFEQPALLFELLRIEANYRSNSGERPTADEYLPRFPQYESALRRALAETIREEGETLPPGNGKPLGPEQQETDAYITQPLQRPQAKSATEVAFTASRFVELKHHDSGGLGDVFRGHDDELGRDVAIKAIQKRLIHNEAVTDQFHVEVKVTSRLDHPGIVPVYGMGKFPDGRPFFVMRFIDGVNFRTAIKEFHAADWKTRPKSEYRAELNRLLEHFCAACHTVSYAHNRGIVHRDIKPQNIMLGRFHETLVVDWGLAVPVQRDEKAKASGEKTVMPRMGEESGSSSGGTAGTLGYMSPEQFQDADAPLGPASDIYSLGATLYHVLTGSAPHQGSSLTETSKVIRTGDFPPPTRINRGCPSALEAVCLKAMSLKPNDRYATATALAKDVQNWMTGERVSVYKEPLFELLLRSAHQHQSWTAGLGIACAVLFGAAVLSSIWMTQAAKSEATMRVKAHELRDGSLRQSAMFAAQTIEANIDKRWRVLSYYAEDPQLAKLIQACDKQEKGSPAFKEMQNWLNGAFLEVQTGEPETTWFISDVFGRQLARVPPDTSVGNNFAHRDYFHGQGLDKEKSEATGLKPIARPHLSNVYLSAVKNSGYRVAFSVPVFANGRQSVGEEPIAVLAMSVKTGAFQVLRNAVLIDLRDDKIDGSAKKGLVLHHEKILSLAAKEENPAPPRLQQARFSKLLAEKDELIRIHQAGDPGNRSAQVMARMIPDYVDPLDANLKGIAAFAPVVVRRDGPGSEPIVPWIVIVPQEIDSAAK